MSYTKQTWANGDIITAAKLNHMEDGIAGVEADVSSLDTQLLASLPHDTASGSIASFPDGAAMPVIDCSVAIEPVQSGSGDPSPDNVRPISGWTECKVTRTGKNLLDASSLVFTSGIRNDSGAQTASANSHYSSEISVKGNTTYTLSGSLLITGTAYRVYFLTNTKGWISRTAQLSSEPYTFTTNAECGYIQIQCATTIDLTEAMLELGSTATAYEAYQGQVYTIDLNGTRYGGTLDVTTGKLTVDRAIDIIDGTQALNENGTQDYGGVQVRYVPSETKKPASSGATQNEGLLSDKFSTNEAYPAAPFMATGRSTNGYIYLNMGADITTAAMARTWFTNNPTQISYLLATPIEVDLTPTEITTLLGTNNIWADAGDTTVSYRADTTLFVNKKIAAAVAALS